MKFLKGLLQSVTGNWRSKAAGFCVGVAGVHLMDGRPIWAFIVLGGAVALAVWEYIAQPEK